MNYTLEPIIPDKPPVQIYLEKDERGAVYIIARDANGDKWHLATLASPGQLKLARGIPTGLGFPLTKQGTLVVVTE